MLTFQNYKSVILVAALKLHTRESKLDPHHTLNEQTPYILALITMFLRIRAMISHQASMCFASQI